LNDHADSGTVCVLAYEGSEKRTAGRNPFKTFWRPSENPQIHRKNEQESGNDLTI